MKTEKLADNHYKRVANFAKEMLVWPEEISVHKIKNPAFISDVKPTKSPVVPPLPVGAAATASPSRNSIEVLDQHRKGAAVSSSRVPVVQQPPMKFNFQTGTERLAQSIMLSTSLDPSPSRRTQVGSDEAVMNLRPEDTAKMLGRPGHLRVKA